MSVPWRLSRVGTLKIVNLFHAAIAHIGDNGDTVLRDWAIALQRAIPNFDGHELRFPSYRLFYLPMPVWEPAPEIIQPSPGPVSEIRVGAIKVITTSASTLVRIGSGNRLAAESRILHIRQYNGLMPGVYSTTGLPGQAPGVTGIPGAVGITGAAGSQ